MVDLASGFNFSALIPPFDNTRDTRFFYESKEHAEALSRLVYIAEDKTMGMGMLTGEIGCGKTITRTVFANRLDKNQFKVVTLENSLLDFDDLLLEIISQIRNERVSPSQFPDRYSRIAEYKRLLILEVANQDKHLIIVLDEAQQFTNTALDSIKGLSNISSERVNYATIILIGQPELRDRIKMLPQVDQRISLRFHINALSKDEVARYLIYRLRTSGLQGRLPFTREAVDHIARVSQGIPRNVNRICKHSLEHAELNDLSRIDFQTVRLVTSDIDTHSGYDSNSSLLG